MPRGAAEWRQVMWLGLPNMLGWHALSIYGLAHLPAGRAAVLGFTMPVWTVALGVLFYGERLTARLAYQRAFAREEAGRKALTPAPPAP